MEERGCENRRTHACARLGVWARERDPRKITHRCVLYPESLLHVLEELVLHVVEFERLLYLVFLAAAGVAAPDLLAAEQAQQDAYTQNEMRKFMRQSRQNK